MVSLLAGCAPLQQTALRPQGPVTPGFSGDWFTSFDGAKLGLNEWLPQQQMGDADGPGVVIIAVHGMNDYAGAFDEAGKWWASQGATVYAYDQRGFGRSPGWMVWPQPDLMRRDLKTAVDVARRLNPGARIGVVGVSMGAAVAATAFADNDPPAADALVLSGPGFRGWGALPWYYSASLWISAHVRPGWIVVPPKGVHITATDNDDELRRMWYDPHVQKSNRIDSVYGVVSIMEAADQALPHLPKTVPTLMTYGGRDQVIPPEGVERAARNLPSWVRTAYYPKGYHMLLRDREAEARWRDILTFIEDPAAPLPSGAPALPWGPPPQVAAQTAER
ncbi:MAG: alpha/beta fold hydrolase [Alphaproteobacteria bacterium]|nr:alpha/beta fold hydrolase [Alphaproteobacteria bacterium]